jgi:hypothetical protein
MPLLVDGNNLLGLRPEVLAKEPGIRRRLVKQLAAYARAKRTSVHRRVRRRARTRTGSDPI